MAHPMSEPWVDWQRIDTAPAFEGVLIWSPSAYQGKGGVFVGIKMADGWFCHPSSVRAEPSHWAPLPAGPKI